MKEVAKAKREKAEKKAQKEAHTRATKDTNKVRQQKRLEEERPVLQWQKDNNFAPPEVKFVGKARLTASFEAHKE